MSVLLPSAREESYQGCRESGPVAHGVSNYCLQFSWSTLFWCPHTCTHTHRLFLCPHTRAHMGWSCVHTHTHRGPIFSQWLLQPLLSLWSGGSATVGISIEGSLVSSPPYAIHQISLPTFSWRLLSATRSHSAELRVCSLWRTRDHTIPSVEFLSKDSVCFQQNKLSMVLWKQVLYSRHLQC